MIKHTAAIVALAAAPLAHAGMIESFSAPMPSAGDAASLEQAADVYTLHIDDGQTFAVDPIAVEGDALDTNNPHYESITLAPGQQAVAVGWDMLVTAPSPSLLSDLRIAITNSSGEGVVLRPYDTITFPGTLTARTRGLIDLDALAFTLNPDAELHFLFFTDFDTLQGSDLSLDSGSIMVRLVPTPGAGAIAGLALAMVSPRRRR